MASSHSLRPPLAIDHEDPLPSRALEEAALGHQERIARFPQLQFDIVALARSDGLRLVIR